jgi:ethanolaminephosphotransferase
MPLKQMEMDEAVQMIYTFVEADDKRRRRQNPTAKKTLIVLTGDHGMNEVGNHGGSTPGEVNTVALWH